MFIVVTATGSIKLWDVEFSEIWKITKCSHQLLQRHAYFFPFLVHWVCLGDSWFTIGSSPRTNVFPARGANLGQARYRSLERLHHDTWWIWFVPCPLASIARPCIDLARPLQPVDFRLFWIISFAFVKVCGICFLSWESFIGFNIIWCYPITTIVACLFIVGIRISCKKMCWKGSMEVEIPPGASYLVYYIVARVNF